jgi:CPA1 family monovalent cation:H+ antiporter
LGEPILCIEWACFSIIGLDLPEITAGLKSEGTSLYTAIGYGLLITLVLIITRILSAYGAVFVTLIARNFIKVADSRNPGFKTPLILGWTGMRGVVSLAAALSIPVTLNGAPFPHRSLILFITFIAILGTLLLQGLTLPVLLAKIKMPDFTDYMADEEAESFIHKELAQESKTYLNSKYNGLWEDSPMLRQLTTKWEAKFLANNEMSPSIESRVMYLDILDMQRNWLIQQNGTNEHIDEDVIRKHIRLIDIEEEQIRSL